MRALCHSTPQRYLRALDMLKHAQAYLERQYSPRMPRAEAIDHFQSRSLLWKHYVRLWNDMAVRFPEMKAEPITQAEIDAAIQQTCEHRAAQEVA